MAVGKTSLSAGEIIRSILISDSEVSARVKKIFPVVEDSAELPYIVYRRAQLEQTPVKSGRGADTGRGTGRSRARRTGWKAGRSKRAGYAQLLSGRQ